MTRVLLLVLAVLLLGGVIFLLTWDMPAPTTRVEEVVPVAPDARPPP